MTRAPGGTGRLPVEGRRPWIIAELSGNHNGSLERALALVDAAAAAGVDAIKLQSYTADSMTIDLDRDEFLIDDPRSPWRGYTLYQLYREASTPWEWHEPLFERAHRHGLAAFSTPFDEQAVDRLEQLDPPAYKIASFESGDLPLIRKVAATGRPLLISTGMATLAELAETVETARSAGASQLILLKCTSSYPAPPDASNLATITTLKDLFGCDIGLSDHTLGIGVAIAAVALGASVVEKHFTLDRSDGGVDSAFSLEPAEMAQLVRECHAAASAIGTSQFGTGKAEEASAPHRRSLYIVRDMQAGERLTSDNLRRIRPGLGLHPRHYEQVLGMRISRPARRGTPLDWDLLREPECNHPVSTD
jgi:pseudaminic acid synthase